MGDVGVQVRVVGNSVGRWWKVEESGSGGEAEAEIIGIGAR